MDLLLFGYDDPASAGHPLLDRYAQIVPGIPGRCPACGDFGIIDAVDVRRALQTQHCRSCRYRWEYKFRDEGTILEVRGSGPLPSPEPPEATTTADDPGTTEASEPVAHVEEPPRGPVERRRVVVRRRQRPLRAVRSSRQS